MKHLKLICVIKGVLENEEPNSGYRLLLSSLETWEVVDRSIDNDTTVNGGDLLIFCNEDNCIVKVRAVERWSFAHCGDITQFWIEGFEDVKDFIPASLLQEFCTTFDVKDAEISLSYMTATLINKSYRTDFRLDEYISAL